MSIYLNNKDDKRSLRTDNNKFYVSYYRTYSTATPSGSSVSVNIVSPSNDKVGLELNFDNVSVGGSTTVEEVKSNSNPSISTPANFIVGDSIASFRITSTASFSGDVVLFFTLPVNISQVAFDSCRIFKVSDGVTSDVTILSGPNAPNFATKKICALVNSFSDFFIIPARENVAATVTPTPSPSATPAATPTPTATPTATSAPNILADRYIGNSWLNYTRIKNLSTIYIGNSWINYNIERVLPNNNSNIGTSWVNYAIPKNLSTIYIGNSWINYNIEKVLPYNNVNIGTSWVNYAESFAKQ